MDAGNKAAWLADSVFFTATAMIGTIALAGIVTRGATIFDHTGATLFRRYLVADLWSLPIDDFHAVRDPGKLLAAPRRQTRA